MRRRGRPRTPTDFERRVYAIVKRIPRGEVRSYQWVARTLGNPKLARAVGQALHHNPWPDRVPCHRVVRADGSSGGYAWGPAKKRRLLAQERLIKDRPFRYS
ncbi:MAG: MGMT family protein [Candidatus Omnitrophica bacterium]|nr:MGMT family protein [Candidatus Omnitrophota bacterium]